jgi:precorrin-6B methylase 2
LQELRQWAIRQRIYTRGKIKKVGNKLILSYANKPIVFMYTDYLPVPLEEIYVEGTYNLLNVENRTVVDIGSSAADTAIYFMLNGARGVYGFDTDAERCKQAKLNLEGNKIKNVKIFCGEYNGTLADVVKVDCEGGEYKLIDSLLSFKEIILEYHQGIKDLVEKLNNAGYKVTVIPNIHAKKKDDGKLGIIYAKR